MGNADNKVGYLHFLGMFFESVMFNN